MNRRVAIPVRVQQTARDRGQVDKQQAGAAETEQRQPERDRMEEVQPEPADLEATAAESRQAPEAVEEQPETPEEGGDELQGWRDRALRLQAEMENYRKRQQRLAQAQIEEERERLLTAFLRVIDDLERALEAPATGDQGLQQGVELTRRAALQALEREGVKPVVALNQPFDPLWHEAVATVGRDGVDAPANSVVKVVQPGYRLGDRLLRPAQVVVAV